MWYQSWQGGYEDILKRGFPKPADERTILAELHSPQLGDFLHNGTNEVPFLVGDRARKVFELHSLIGFEFGPVVVAKIATKGMRNKKVKAGEPEDSILKSKSVSLDAAPALYSVRITASVPVQPDYDSGKTPSGSVSPFRLATVDSMPDLWRPNHRGSNFSAWTFCSERFRTACESGGLADIAFEDFDTFMNGYRDRLQNGRKG